jgi:hypothetical protein
VWWKILKSVFITISITHIKGPHQAAIFDLILNNAINITTQHDLELI